MADREYLHQRHRQDRPGSIRQNLQGRQGLHSKQQTQVVYEVLCKITFVHVVVIIMSFQANQAHLHGAKGIIIYSDPADYAVDGESSQVYPRDWWLPPSGTQRGTILLGSGDPLTPGYPATGITCFLSMMNAWLHAILRTVLFLSIHAFILPFTFRTCIQT